MTDSIIIAGMTTMAEKKLLFSVTKDDCDWQTFRSGGPGGQNVNKVSSGVRCIHRASGARGESRTSRNQLDNRHLAFRRMAETKEFKIWHKLESARRMGGKSIDVIVNDAMLAGNLKVEVRGEDGQWTAVAHDR